MSLKIDGPGVISRCTGAGTAAAHTQRLWPRPILNLSRQLAMVRLKHAQAARISGLVVEQQGSVLIHGDATDRVKPIGAAEQSSWPNSLDQLAQTVSVS